jgi:hypothetical protein
MKNVIRVNPRSKTPVLEKCPQCGGTDLELRPDGAFLCKTCFYVTRPRVNVSLLQSWSRTIFSLEDEGPPPEELVFGGKVAGAGGVLFLVGIALALGPFEVSGFIGRLLRPTPPSELAFLGGITVVTILGLICLFAGYTMSRGDSKAWQAILPVGLIGVVLGILGPGGVLAAIGGGIAAVGGYIGRAE